MGDRLSYIERTEETRTRGSQTSVRSTLGYFTLIVITHGSHFALPHVDVNVSV